MTAAMAAIIAMPSTQAMNLTKIHNSSVAINGMQPEAKKLLRRCGNHSFVHASKAG
jgi:hypothetical protein